MSWLQVAHAASTPPDGSDVGQVIRWYRTYEGMTQQDAAVRLNTTQSRLSQPEKGTQALRDVTELRHIARMFGIPAERLGVLPDRSAEAIPFASHVSDRPGPIRDSQEHWREIRRQLNAHRALLGDLAAELYPAQGRAPELIVNGEGTAVRDFVHVADMATAFVLALHACQPGNWRAYNVGSGHPSTVHEVIATAETVTGRPVPRRHTATAHEPATLLADSTRIRSELGWQPEKSSLLEIISDAWSAVTSD